MAAEGIELSMVAPDFLADFERQGYALIKQVIDAAQVDALRRVLQTAFDAEGTNVLNDAVLRFPEVWDIFRVPRLVEGLAELLGRPFVVPPHTSAEFGRFGTFHTDTTGAEMSGQMFHKSPEFRMVTVAIYLQDNNEYGGGIRLIPGSHKEPDPYVALTTHKNELRRKIEASPVKRLVRRLSRGRLYDWEAPFRDHVNAIDIPSRPGDAIIWDMRLAHRASPRRSMAPGPQGPKIALFFTAGRDNHITTGAYMDYMESVPGNAHLQVTRAMPGVVIPAATSDFYIL